MNSPLLKKAIPHLVAMVIFLVVAVVYCKPALDSKVLNQTDVIGHTAMAKQSFDFNNKYGRFPLWTESMFSGMPAYNIQMYSPSVIVNFLYPPLTLWLPKPISYFYLACICFYILTQVLRIDPWIGVLSALAYTYSTFDPIIVGVGHDTQMLAIGFAPAVIAGLLVIYQRKFLLGATMLCIFFGLQLSMTQHLQIVYYTLIMLGFITLAYLAKCWKEKQVRNAVIGIAVALGAGAIGFGTYAVELLPVQEYAKETMRGGKSELTQGDSKNKTKGGLDKDYAFSWSYGIAETFSLFVPGIYGGGNMGKLFTDNSKFADKLEENFGVPETSALQNANQSAYWGSQGGKLGTAGPVYLGAVICFLFIFGGYYFKSWHKWWILSVTVFAIFLAWGRNFQAFNYFLFDHLPFYSKFRSPTMSLVIPQLTFPLLAALGLDQLLVDKESKEIIWKKFKTSVMITIGLLLIVTAFYFSADFKGPNDLSMKENFANITIQQISRGKQPTPEMEQQANELGNSLIKALQEDRRSLFSSDLLRTFFLIAVAVVLLGLYLKNKIKPLVLVGALIVLSSYDLLAEGRKYLSEENFVDPADIESVFAPSPADQLISRDPDKNFRVYDLTEEDPFSNARPSYYHNSIGGYHPAKLGLYQDLIQNQIGKGNMMVFNMLNTKYFIQPNPSTHQPQAQMNPNAFGPCWLVKSIHYVNNADEEMKALDSINVRDTAIVQKSFRNLIKFQPVPDTTASLRLIQNLNDKIIYKFSSKTNQFAVFSEIYYDKGWNAFIDGKKSDYCKVDYVLRGMPVPAGDHTIEFRFEPSSFKTGETISWIASVLAYLLLGATIWVTYKGWGKKDITTV
jgi:Bacterial membrane protein YfhO